MHLDKLPFENFRLYNCLSVLPFKKLCLRFFILVGRGYGLVKTRVCQIIAVFNLVNWIVEQFS